VKIEKKIPPRKFAVGLKDLEISHVADVYLEHDQMVTFVTNDGAEYDVVKKNWGYYATPSLGGRLRNFGLRAAIMRNIDTRQCFIILAHENRIDILNEYMRNERQEIVLWLDDFEKLSNIKSI